MVASHAECPFTKLLPVLVKYEYSESGSNLAYTLKELIGMSECIENANRILLQGMQDVGRLLSQAARNNKGYAYTENLGDFISAVTNLVEALSDFNKDIHYVLDRKQL